MDFFYITDESILMEMSVSRLFLKVSALSCADGGFEIFLRMNFQREKISGFM